jgi:hypothetical protein
VNSVKTESAFTYDGFGNRTAQTVTKGSGPNGREMSRTPAQVGIAAQFTFDRDNASYLAQNNLTNGRVSDVFVVSLGTQAWTPFGGGTIYIDAGRLGTRSSSRNEALVMHETLRESYGLDDTDVLRILRPDLFKNDANAHPASSLITDWLQQNCVNGKGNN